MDKLLTLKQTAFRLGMCTATLRNLLKGYYFRDGKAVAYGKDFGLIPVYVGKVRRFRESDINKLIKAGATS